MFRGSFLIENYRYSLKFFSNIDLILFFLKKAIFFLGLEGIHCRKIGKQENKRNNHPERISVKFLVYLPPIFGFKALIIFIKDCTILDINKVTFWLVPRLMKLSSELEMSYHWYKLLYATDEASYGELHDYLGNN